MTREQFVRQHGVRLVPKAELWWFRLIARPKSVFMVHMWTVVRFPFCRGVAGYPSSVTDPMSPKYHNIRMHELVHVRQQRTAGGLFWSIMLYFFLPLPRWYSGRWFVERHAYLQDIKNGSHTVDSAVGSLHRFYWRPWPKESMRRWFEAQLLEHWASDAD